MPSGTNNVQPLVLPTYTGELFERAVHRAAEFLRAGQVVALPTETVYGLAANALNPEAVNRIFQIKGRPAHNPIIVHVESLAMAWQCVDHWPPQAGKLARAFWPGPLTMVMPRAREIPDIVTAGGPTVGVRWPSHPFIQAVIRECGFPLAAPSANRSNHLSPTTAEHVLSSLGARIPLIIDGGQSEVGIESTVIDLSVNPPRLLRPGMIHEAALLPVLGELASGRDEPIGPLKSPGQLPRHYAPRAKLVVLRWANQRELESLISKLQVPASKTHVISHTRFPSGKPFGRLGLIPLDPEAFAHALYAELHYCDDLGAELIVVEALPETNEWRAVSDRLKRAAAD